MKRSVLTLAVIVLAAASTESRAGGVTALQETVTPVFRHELPNIPGKALVALEVLYPPGAASPPHTHPKSAFIYAYVLSGDMLSAVDNEEPRLYRTGESWYEVAGAHHRVSRNASTTRPAKLLALFILDHSETELVKPDVK